MDEVQLHTVFIYVPRPRNKSGRRMEIGEIQLTVESICTAWKVRRMPWAVRAHAPLIDFHQFAAEYWIPSVGRLVALHVRRMMMPVFIERL